MMYYRILSRCTVYIALQLKSACHGTNRKVMRISCCSYSNEYNNLFQGVKDIYGGVTVDTTKEKWQQATFSATLDESMDEWLNLEKRCIWFKVNIKDSVVVPLLAQKGFNFHHARDDFVMMYKWIPTDSEPNLPPACHTNLGVGAMVFNDQNKLLVVSEQHYNYPHWKLPGGYVERGEDIIDAAIREVQEETGVDTAFQSLVTFRHTHNMTFGNSDIYVLVMLQALTNEITISEREVKQCQWMSIGEYTNHEHVHAFNKLIINKALEYKNKKMKLNFEKKTVKWSTYVRDMNYLVVEDFDYK